MPPKIRGFIALTHVGLGFAWFPPPRNCTGIELRYGKFKHVSQFEMCEATECFGSAGGSWPWAAGCLNVKFTVQSTPGDGAGESLMPHTMRPFQSGSRWSLAGVDGRGKAFWQLNEEFIWNVLRCGRRICLCFTKLQVKTQENIQLLVYSAFCPVLSVLTFILNVQQNLLSIKSQVFVHLNSQFLSTHHCWQSVHKS